jgi:hypothetical protein
MNKFIIQTATILYQFGNIREYSTCLWSIEKSTYEFLEGTRRGKSM